MTRRLLAGVLALLLSAGLVAAQPSLPTTGGGGGGGPVTSSQITDSTAAGRAVLTAPDAPAQRSALGLPGPYWPAWYVPPGFYIWPAGLTQQPVAGNLQTGRAFAIPFDIQQPVTLDRIGWGITTGPASATPVRFGIAPDVGGAPGAVTCEAAEQTVAVSYTGDVSPTVSCPLTAAGRYYVVILPSASLTGYTLNSASMWLDMPAAGTPGGTGVQPWGWSATATYGPLTGTTLPWTRYFQGGSNRMPVPGVRVGSNP